MYWCLFSDWVMQHDSGLLCTAENIWEVFWATCTGNSDVGTAMSPEISMFSYSTCLLWFSNLLHVNIVINTACFSEVLYDWQEVHRAIPEHVQRTVRNDPQTGDQQTQECRQVLLSSTSYWRHLMGGNSPFFKKESVNFCSEFISAMDRYLLYNYILWKTLIVLLLKNFSKSPISFLGDRLNCICLNLWSVKEGFCFVQVLEVIKLNEDDTTSASRIFIKVLFQELSEYLGLPKLNDRLKDP